MPGPASQPGGGGEELRRRQARSVVGGRAGAGVAAAQTDARYRAARAGSGASQGAVRRTGESSGQFVRSSEMRELGRDPAHGALHREAADTAANQSFESEIGRAHV